MAEFGTVAPAESGAPRRHRRRAADAGSTVTVWSRLSGLPQHQLVGIGVFSVLLVVLLVANWDGISRPDYETGDFAANSILIDRAKSFQLFHGNYSRFGFYHPGPALMSVQAVAEVALHDVLDLVPTPLNAHRVGVFVLNSAMVALSAGVVARRTGAWTTGVLLAVMAVAYGWVLDGALSSSWPPLLYIWPFLLLVVTAGSLFTGEGTDLWKFVLAASLLVHGHVAFSLFAIGFSVAVAIAWVRCHGRASIERIPMGSGIAAAAVLVVFVAPIVVEVVRDFPGQFDDYLGYDRPASAPRDMAGVARFLFAFWAPDDGGVVFGVVATLGALALAGRSRPQTKRTYLLALLASAGLGWLLAAVYARFFVDDLVSVYTSYFYLAVPVVICTVLLGGAVDTYAASSRQAVRVGTLVVLAAGTLFVTTRPGLENPYPGSPAVRAGHLALEEVLAPAESAAFLFEFLDWPLVAGLVVQARRADQPVCAQVEGGLFDPEDEELLGLIFTEDEVCTSEEIATGREILVAPPGPEIHGTMVYADDEMVITDVSGREP